MSQNTPAREILKQEGVHVIGDFQGSTAICQSGRDVVDAVDGLGFPHEVLDLPLSPDRMPPSSTIDASKVDYHKPKSRLSIINWNGDCYEIIARDMPRDLFQDRRIIGIWFWETEQDLPEGHRQGYNYVDEVWVTSKFIADSLSKNSPVPVRQFPQLFKPLRLPEKRVLPEKLQNDRFVFLFTFDYRSVSRRKNPEGVCEAFVKAFPEPTPDGPICVVKSVAGKTHHKLEYLELFGRYMHRPDIIFMDGWVSFDERNSLMDRANCYLSLHRSEGLGLTLMECMSLGKPCIATNYSGNLEFMTPENSWLIPYKIVSIGEGAWPYPPEHTWAEPDLDVAAAAMKEVFSNAELAAQKGELGRQTILTNHSKEAVSAKIQELLLTSIAIPPRAKGGVLATTNDGADAGETGGKTQSGRARAYTLLKEAKQAEKKSRARVKNMKPRLGTRELLEHVRSLQDIIKLQNAIQAETLRDLGEIKKRLHNYHGAKLDALMRDRDLTAEATKRLLELAGQSFPDQPKP